MVLCVLAQASADFLRLLARNSERSQGPGGTNFVDLPTDCARMTHVPIRYLLLLTGVHKASWY